jgi:hypothetical protein
MARARRQEAPMAEEPKESSTFDVSEFETTSPETPKAKKAKMETVPTKSRRIPKHVRAKQHPLPGVPKHVNEVEEALDVVHETIEESARDAKLAPTDKSDVDQSLDELRGIADEKAWEAKIAEAKAKIAEEERGRRMSEMGDRVEKSMAEDDEAARLAEEKAWDEKIADTKAGITQSERRMSEMGDRVEKSMAEDEAMGLSEDESTWFKKGEDAAHVKAVAEQQQIEGLRKDIASYDEGKKEVIIDTPEEIDAAVKRAESMIKSDELHMDLFDIRAYEFLLTEQARIDRELESSGWWDARGLRSELKDVRKDLRDYEEQMESVERERADARRKARGLPSFPARKVQAREGSGTTVHKEGSGTSVHTDRKPGIFARLFGKK